MTVLTRVSLKNRLVVGLITLAVAAFGLTTIGSLRQELMPSMTQPTAFIQVQADGIAPDQMVESVTEPIEQALKSVPALQQVTSTTSTGSAQIIVDWPFDKDQDETMRAIRGAVDAVSAGLPAGAKAEAFPFGTDSMPAMQLSAGSSGEQAEFVRELEQRVLPALRAVNGVQKVELAGQAAQRVEIQLRPADAAKLGIVPAQIPAALAANGAVRPAGEAGSDAGPISVSVGQDLASLEDVLALPLTGPDGVVTLGQVADAELKTLPENVISRVNGKPSLTLTVTPGTGANVVDISHGVTAALADLAPSLGAGAEFVTLFDQAPYIEQSVHDLSVEGGLGLIFAVIVILVFLWSVRPTVIAAVSIPLSLLITLIGLKFTDNTLNMLTLGALTIAVGRVVDDSIVVIENIKRHQAGGPLTPESILRSVKQVSGAITASTLTTVAVFLPIAFVSGIAGQLFRPFAVTVTIALLASLLVALTIVPVLAYWLLRGKNPLPGESAPELSPEAAAIAADETQAPVDRLQRAFLPWLGATRRHPVITLTASGAMLLVTLFLATMLPIDFLGQSGQQTVSITQTLPRTLTLAERSDAAKPLETAIGKISGVENTVTSLSAAAPGAEDPATSLQVLLAEGADTEAVTGKIRRAVEAIPDAGEITVAQQDSAGIGGSTIDLSVRGDNREALVTAAEALEAELGGAGGVDSVTNTLKGEQPTLRVVVDRAKAASVGYDQETVAAVINAALSGIPAGNITLEGAERDIVIAPSAAGSTKAQLEQLPLPVTPQQTQQAQKAVTDRMKAEGEAKAEQARIDAQNELSQQIGAAQQGRAEATQQLGQLRQQLAELSSAPIQVPPATATTPKAEAQAKAEAERAEQLAALAQGIAGAEQAITQMDEQLTGLADAERNAGEQLAEQERLEQEQRDLEKLTGTPIPVSAIAEVIEELGPAEIQRTDGARVVTVQVTPKPGQLEAASAAVDRAMSKVELPTGVEFDVSGVSAEQEDSFGQLGLAMLAAIVLVLLIMVATFRSLVQPLILLVSIPFAATGAVIALLVSGTALGLPAMIGLLMLIGIVVTNAIVLIDLINRLREDGVELDDAVHHGTRLRLRPILMTAAATIFALIPMSLGLTGGGVFISKPLAVVVIGGLISSTLLTIVLVPILYTLFARGAIKRGERRLARRVRAAERRAERAGETLPGDRPAEHVDPFEAFDESRDAEAGNARP